MNNTALSERQQGIAKVAASTALGKVERLKPVLSDALDGGLRVSEIKEILVQMYAYTGFPRALNGLAALMQVLEERRARGINDAEGPGAAVLDRAADKRAYGNRVQVELTGSEVRGGVMDFAPAIDAFLKEHLFADIFARGVLSYQDREIATIAALFALDDVESQLGSHINIGKNTGLSDAQIGEIQWHSIAAKAFTPLFGRGEPNPFGQYFTGQTYLTMLNTNDSVFNAPVGNVTFTPGARTYWHRHSGGQILLVTDGEGRYQERGGSVRTLCRGDVVRINPNVEHWHGAAPKSWFSHVALEPNAPNNQVTWLEPVAGEAQ